MIRPIAILAGLGFVVVLLWSLLWGAIAYVQEPPQPTVEHEFHAHPKHVSFASDGPLGKFDRQQLQRGFAVFRDVCAACHSLHQVAFRDLEHIGFSEGEVKAIANQWLIEQPAVNPEDGSPTTRKSIAADKFPKRFANEIEARASNNGALPPDLSLITKARHDGPAYTYSLLTGYQNQPAELLKHFPDAKTPEGLHYNPYFANLNIAMAPPITADGQVQYAEGQPKATVDQMSQDVAAFLVWTAEPKLEERHQAGWAVLIFLIIATGLGFMAYRNIWSGTKH